QSYDAIAPQVGLTLVLSAKWPTAERITGGVAAGDAADPVKFDFALCHKRMSGDCLDRRDAKVCTPCGFKAVCRHWRGRRRAGGCPHGRWVRAWGARALAPRPRRVGGRERASALART